MKTDIFTKQILSGMIQLNPLEHNSGIDETLLEKLKEKVEGKCDSFGYIKPDSVNILKRSMGKCQAGQFNGHCNYKLAYSVEVCNPVEGMIIKCVVKNINKMGLFCEMADMSPSPISVILAKQHHMDESKDSFDNVKLNDVIQVEIVGKKFNYNDTIISCIGKLSHNDMTMEEKLEMPDASIEVELDINSTADSEEDLNSTEIDSENEDKNTDSEEEDETNRPEGVVLEKELQQEEMDVLKELQSVPQVDSGDIDENEDMEHMEGVQDLESVDLVAQSSEGNLKTNVHSYQNEIGEEVDGEDELAELGEEFLGEKVSLDELSSASHQKVFNEEQFEKITTKPGKEVFKLEVLSHPKYKTFSRPIKNTKKFVKYMIYVQLNNMMIKYYELNNVAPKYVYLNQKHPYLEQMKEYLAAMGKSLKVEEVEGTSYVN